MPIIETLSTHASLTTHASHLVTSQGSTFDVVLKKALAKDSQVQQENRINTAPFPSSKQSTPAQELQKWLDMSPEERLFFTVLASLGISKEEFEAMSPEEKSEITHKVQEHIQEMTKEGVKTQIV